MRRREEEHKASRNTQVQQESTVTKTKKEIEEIRKQREVIRIVSKIWSNNRLNAEESDLIIEEFAKRNELNKKEISVEALKTRIKDNYFAILIESYEEIIRNCEAARNLSTLNTLNNEDKEEIKGALPEAVNGILGIKERRFNIDLEARDKEEREYIVRKYIKDVTLILNRHGYLFEKNKKKIDLQRVDLIGFNLSGLDLSFVEFGRNSLEGVDFTDSKISVEQLVNVKTLKDIIIEPILQEEIVGIRHKLCIESIDFNIKKIKEAKEAIDYLEYLYCLSCSPSDFEGLEVLSVIEGKLRRLNDNELQYIALLAMASNQINLLLSEHELSFDKVSYNRDLISTKSREEIIGILNVMLKEREYSLAEDVISFIIFNKLYHLYNTITDMSQFISDVEIVLDEFNKEQKEEVIELLVNIKRIRKEYLADEEQVKRRNDIRSIEEHLDHLNDEADIALGAGPTDRLDTVLNIARESNQPVDLTEVDLEQIDFNRIDFSELEDTNLIMTVEQENKHLSVEQREQRYRRLFERAKNGDIAGVEESLSKGSNINTSGEYNKTALVYACEAGRYEVVKLLIERGADVKVLSQGERTLLMNICAAQQSNDEGVSEGRLKLIGYLIEQGAEVNAKDREGMTALMHACISGQLDIAEVLVRREANVNVANAIGRTALMIAGYYGRLDIVKLLVENGADINAKTEAGWKIIEGLLHGEQPENIKQIVEYLISKGAKLDIHSAIKLGDINKIDAFNKKELEVVNQDERGGAIHAAVRAGRVDILEILRKKGLNLNQIDVYGRNALHIACEVGKVDIVRYLVREGLDINAIYNKQTPIQIVVSRGNLQMARMLRNAGAKLDLESMVALYDKHSISHFLEGYNVDYETKDKLLYLCYKYNRVEIAKQLIEDHKININVEIEGVRGIDIACELGNAEIVELLMKYKGSNGFDINDNSEEPLLFKAISNNRERVIDILLSNGANPNVIHGWLKEDVLLYAIRMINRNKIDIIKLAKRLIENGVDIGHMDNRGNTVLHYAAEEGNEELVEVIISGFKNIKNKAGRRAYEIAKEKGHNIKILEESEEEISLLEDMEDFVEVVKPSSKNKEKEYRDRKEQNEAEELLTASANGNDRNLLIDGHDRYWYSISDGFRLLMHTRKTRLKYDNVVNEGEEYSAYRENREGLFIADPYHVLNFRENFEDDIRRLSGQQVGIEGWSKPINTIIIPLLDGLHWRSIRVTMDYENNKISILWDDPYGRNSFPAELKDSIKQSIIKTISALCEAEIEVEEVEKIIDQQGRGVNGYDCGPIVFSNINDYAISSKSNKEFIRADKHAYTIGEYSEKLHNQNMRGLRRFDARHYAEMSGMNLSSVENRRAEIETKNAQSLQDKVGGIKLELLSDKQLERINSLPTLYISMIFDIVENNRTWKGERAGEAYSTEELSKAYNHVIMYKEQIENLCTNEVIHDNSNIHTNSNSTASINERGNQRRESTRNISSPSSSSSSVGNKKDKDCIVSAVYSASYNNPILNDKHVDKLLEAANLNYGAEGVDKLIEIGSDINNYKKFQSLRTIVSDDVAVRLYIKQELGKEQNINKGFIERLGINHSAIQVLSLSEKSNQNLSYTKKLYQEAELVESNKQKAIVRNS